MKTKSFVSSTSNTKSGKKTPDYWGIIFISFVFLSTFSCFLFANHMDQSIPNRIGYSALEINVIITDIDQQQKS